MFFWKILKVGNLGRLVCAYCLLKDDMPFVSGSYRLKSMTTSKNLAYCFQKAKKNGSNDFNPEVTEKLEISVCKTLCPQLYACL